MPDNLFGIPDVSDRDQRLIEAYVAAGRTLDDLPYTREFEGVMAAVGEWFEGNDHAVFRRLHTLRKAARLPKLGVRGVSPVAVKPEEEELLVELVKGAAGTLGQRDQLPYTDAFEEISRAFNTRTERNLPPHDVWRLIARLAK